MPRRSYCTSLLLVAVLSVSAAHATRAQDRYGPPFEFGVGFTGFRSMSYPEWVVDYYGGVAIGGAVRIFAGLGVAGGIEYQIGASPEPDELTYSDDLVLMSDKGTDGETRWYGVRYELPLDIVGIEYKSIHSVVIGGGVTSTRFGLNLDKWKRNGIEEPSDTGNIRTATADGYYIMAAARWKLLTNETIESGSWLGSYGIDAGVRYNRYTDVSTGGGLLEAPSDSFGSLQVFIIGFMKVNFLF